MSNELTSDARRRDLWLALALNVGVLVALYGALPYATGYGTERRPVGYWLWYFWRSPDWQHCALVLPMIAALLWHRRESLFGEKSIPPPLRGSLAGVMIAAFASLIYLIGYRSNVYYFGYLSAQLLVAGMIVWLAGWRWFGRLFFFWCLLAFLWPLYFLGSRLGFPLRMLMTDLSSGVLHCFSVEHLRQGTALLSPADAGAGVAVGDRFALEVANPCSGLRSLFSLTMVGAVFGYLALQKPWQWILLTASALPLAVIGNAARILLLLAASRWLGSDFAVGVEGATSEFHLFAGVTVFLVALSGMAGLVRLLRWWQQRVGRSGSLASDVGEGTAVESATVGVRSRA